MTHYTVDYSKMTPNEKHRQALCDIEDFLGAVRFAGMYMDFTRVRDEEGYIPTLDAFHMIMSFAGVRGYPATALYNEIWPFG